MNVCQSRSYQDHIRNAQATILYGEAPRAAGGAGADKGQSKAGINVPSSWRPASDDAPAPGGCSDGAPVLAPSELQ